MALSAWWWLWGGRQPHKQPPAHRQDADTAATHALPAEEALWFRKYQNPRLAWTQQGQALQQGLNHTHGWRHQKSSSHSNCLFHPSKKLTWGLQCYSFHSGYPISLSLWEMQGGESLSDKGLGGSMSLIQLTGTWHQGRGWKMELLQNWLIYWTRVTSHSQTGVGQKVKSRCHGLGSFLWKSVVPRRLVLASTPPPSHMARKGLWTPDTNSCQSRETFPYAKPRRQKLPFPKSRAENPVLRQLLVRFWWTFC